MHDRSVCQDGVYDKARRARSQVRRKHGFRINDQLHAVQRRRSGRVARFFDASMELGADGITVSPGYAYERAPDQQHFLNRDRTKQLFRDVFRRGDVRKWSFNQSSLFLDFLAGNQEYHCTPWGNPTRNVFGWQRPCYLLGEGYVHLQGADGRNRLGHIRHRQLREVRRLHGPLRLRGNRGDGLGSPPVESAPVALRGIETEEPMVPDIPLEHQRPPQYVSHNHVERKLAEIAETETKTRPWRARVSALQRAPRVARDTWHQPRYHLACATARAPRAIASSEPSGRMPRNAACGMR